MTSCGDCELATIQLTDFHIQRLQAYKLISTRKMRVSANMAVRGISVSDNRFVFVSAYIYFICTPRSIIAVCTLKSCNTFFATKSPLISLPWALKYYALRWVAQQPSDRSSLTILYCTVGVQRGCVTLRAASISNYSHSLSAWRYQKEKHGIFVAQSV